VHPTGLNNPPSSPTSTRHPDPTPKSQKVKKKFSKKFVASAIKMFGLCSSKTTGPIAKIQTVLEPAHEENGPK
jgi:hypothetical protein